MKNRFFNNNNEDDFPDGLFPSPEDMGDEGDMDYSEEGPDFDGDGEEVEYHNNEEIQQALELERRDLNQKILFRTIKFLGKSSWFWRFYSQKYKNRIIDETYLEFQRLITLGEFQHLDYDEDFD